MKTVFYILSIITIFSFSTNAQSLSLAVIPVAGAHTESSSSLSWTLGELSIDTKKDDFHLTEGFQQGALELFYKDSLTFDAYRVDNEYVNVNWSLESELNSEGYYVQRMAEGDTEFEDVTYIKRGKNDLQTVSYEIEDENALYTKSYYRLKHILNDGSVHFTSVKEIEGISLIKAVNVYPNPTVHHINVAFETKNMESLQMVNIQVFDMNGRQVIANESVEVLNDSVFQINGVQSLTNGNYVLIATLNNQPIGQFKFVKINN